MRKGVPLEQAAGGASGLPDKWVRTTLGYCSRELYRYPTFYGMEHLTSGIPVIRGEHIMKGGSISHDENDYWYVSPQVSSAFPRTIVGTGDLVMSVRGSIGKVGIIDDALCGAQVSPNCIRISLFANQCSSKWVFFYLRFAAVQAQVQGLTSATTIQTIKAGLLAKVAIPLPPLLEQRRIIAKIEELLTKLDAGVGALNKVKAQLRRYRQAVLREAFQGKLTERWREAHRHEIEAASALLKRIEDRRKKEGKPALPQPTVKSDLPELPEGWVLTTVGQITQMMQYGTSEKATDDTCGIPVIRMGNIQDGTLVFDGLKFYPRNWPQLEDFVLNDGDVLFNRTNSAELVGKTAVYKKPHQQAVFASYLIRLRLYENAYRPELLSFFINSVYGRGYIASVASQQVGQANVNSTKLSMMPIPLIPILEQHKMVDEIERCLTVSREVEEVVGQSLQKAERLRQSILKIAFEGKLVPQDPSDEPAEKLLERIREEKAKGTIGSTSSRKSRSSRQARLV